MPGARAGMVRSQLGALVMPGDEEGEGDAHHQRAPGRGEGEADHGEHEGADDVDGARVAAERGAYGLARVGAGVAAEHPEQDAGVAEHRAEDQRAGQRCHEAASIVATEAGLAHRQKRKRPEQSLAFEWEWNVATTTATPTAVRPWG